MPAIIKKLFAETKRKLLFITAIIFFAGCYKNSETEAPKSIRGNTPHVTLTDSTFVTITDSSSVSNDTTSIITDTTTVVNDSSENGSIPVLGSIQIDLIATTQALIAGTIAHSEGSAITEIGICYATHSNVSINDNLVQAGNQLNSFVIDLSGLVTGTTYYVRSYAKNTSGIGYSNEVSFTTTNDANAPLGINGTWKGMYSEASVFCDMRILMQLDVTITGNQFHGILTATGTSTFPIKTLTGVLNSDSTQLTLQPEGAIAFENPWTIAGNKISGFLHTDLPIPPDTIVVTRRFEFTKQ